MALALLSTCGGGGDERDAALEIDGLLTVASLMGGDVSLVVAQTACDLGGPAIVSAAGTELARLDAPEPLLIAGLDDERLRFQIIVPAEALDPARFGLPARTEVQVTARCGERSVQTRPFALTYVPTLAATLPPVTPRRFWASDAIGELLLCSGTKLVRAGFDAVVLEELELGFPCVEGELRGSVGERRYLFAENAGIAAIDPGPSVAWARELRFQGTWVDEARDPIVHYEEGGAQRIVALDRVSGLDLTAPLALAHSPRHALSRNEAGEVLVLTSTRNVAGVNLTYYVERFSASGAPLGALEVIRYDWDAPSYIAEFSFDGAVLFYTAAPTSESERHIERIEIASGARGVLTVSSDPWSFALGEAWGRLLVASEDEFRWLDPETGVALSEPFAPDSGNAFLRLRVEQDGSVIMLGDPASQLANGLYVFAPDGADVMRFHEGGTVFRWLAEDWTGGSLVAYFEEVHALPTRAEYEAMRE